jgi:hypothetical protein
MAKTQEEVKTCNHVKPNGSCCQSPAIRDDEYCYFHRLQRERTKRQLRAARRQKPLELPHLEDLESIHLALGDVLNALVADRIDHRKAGLLLYGLQTATATIRHCDFRTDEYKTRMVVYTDRERATLEEEVEQEIKREQAAERRAAARAAKAASGQVPQETGFPTSGDVPDVGNDTADPDGCPTSGDVPDVGEQTACTTAPALPEKKPATGVSKEQFWGVVGAMASQNAREYAKEARRLLEAADHAHEQQEAEHEIQTAVG